MSNFGQPTRPVSTDSDASSEGGFDFENWFRNNHADANARWLADEPYGPMSLHKKDDWIEPMNAPPMNTRSVIPSKETPGRWAMIDLEVYGYAGNVQGWKLHVGCHPKDFRAFFKLMANYLMANQIAHKFLPFSSINHPTGRQVDGRQGEGKSCVIYPHDPRALRTIVLEVDALIRAENAAHQARQAALGQPTTAKIRPYPGGVRGDLAVGSTGFIGTRYGGFKGGLADKGSRFNPFKKSIEADPRLTLPYPPFAANIPAEIRAILR